jgi:hypothetical protein
MRVAILAKGPTLALYPGRESYDEVWGLNQLGKTHDLDLLFIMDDLKLRMPAWDAELPELLKAYERPIVTSRAYPEWPTSVEFPLKDLVAEMGLPLGLAIYSTVDAMIAFGILRKVERMDLYGVDCMQPRREERERVSIAMWIAVAQSRGIKVTVQGGSFFQWYTNTGTAFEHGLYGYAGPPRIEDLYAATRDGPERSPHWNRLSVASALDADRATGFEAAHALPGDHGYSQIQTKYGHLLSPEATRRLLEDVAIKKYWPRR